MFYNLATLIHGLMISMACTAIGAATQFMISRLALRDYLFINFSQNNLMFIKYIFLIKFNYANNVQ